jgi:hypothetical protein
MNEIPDDLLRSPRSFGLEHRVALALDLGDLGQYQFEPLKDTSDVRPGPAANAVPVSANSGHGHQHRRLDGQVSTPRVDVATAS